LAGIRWLTDRHGRIEAEFRKEADMAKETTKPVKTEVPVPAPARPAKTAVARPMTALEEMDRLMDRTFGSLLPGGWLKALRAEHPLLGQFGVELPMPKVDLIERDEELVLRAEVPGVDKKDLDISLTHDSVTIKGQTSHESKEEKGSFFRCEMSRGSFSRTVALPSDVDPEKAKASFKDGVIELAMPKVEKAKRRSIKLD
jgi:HSP20 family protein